MRAVELNTEGPFDLAASLESGQAHRWEREGQWYYGVVRGSVIKLCQTAGRIEFRGGPYSDASLLPLLNSYFRLDDDISAIYAEIGRDQKVADMIARFPGLRLLRIEPWECVVSFILSANSNLRRIHQSMENLAEGYGTAIRFEGRVWHAFPTPAELAEAGEEGLRRLGLGFRAPYVAKATRMALEGRLDLAAFRWTRRRPFPWTCGYAEPWPSGTSRAGKCCPTGSCASGRRTTSAASAATLSSTCSTGGGWSGNLLKPLPVPFPSRLDAWPETPNLAFSRRKREGTASTSSRSYALPTNSGKLTGSVCLIKGEVERGSPRIHQLQIQEVLALLYWSRTPVSHPGGCALRYTRRSI